MHISALSPEFLDALSALLPDTRLIVDPAGCWPYGLDNSRQHALPGAVVFPINEEEVRAVVELAYRSGIPLVTRGHGTGTAAAAVPEAGWLVIAMDRMDRIIRIDADNRLMVVQPGVTNQRVQDVAASAGFFWAPDPTSAAVCTVGGNLACNSAGPRAVKYGTTRDNVLGLRAVTGTGEPFKTGVLTTKGVVGYDLTRLLIGSEGTLAVITEAVLKLTPLPSAKRTLQATYANMGSAAHAVANIMSQPTTPCALEFIDKRAIQMERRYSEAQLPEEAGALLMIEVDGSEQGVGEAAALVARAAEVDGCLGVRVATTIEEVQELWKTRKALSPALRNVAPKKINEDVVVPVSHIPALIEGLERLSQRFGITIVNFGHAGNGNIHVNLLVDPDDPAQVVNADNCLSEVFDLVLGLEGTLSGEHGIGRVKRDYVGRELDAVALRLMRQIKAQFDPAGIMNPGKKLPPE